MIDQNDPRLTAYVLGELSSAEMTEIEQAIQDSPQLAAAVEEIQGVVGLLGDAYVSEEKLSLSDEQKVTLTAKSKVAKSDEARRWIAVAIAASLAAIIFGGWWISQDYSVDDKLTASSVAQIEPIAPTDSLPEVVYRSEIVTRAVPVQKTRLETRTRTAPVTRMRQETREVTSADGKKTTETLQVPYIENVPQSYQVAVPYTENVTQNYTVQVPYTADGQRIAEADYGKYGISAEDHGRPARPAEFLSGGEVPIQVGIVGGGMVFPDADEWIEQKDARSNYPGVRLEGGTSSVQGRVVDLAQSELPLRGPIVGDFAVEGFTFHDRQTTDVSSDELLDNLLATVDSEPGQQGQQGQGQGQQQDWLAAAPQSRAGEQQKGQGEQAGQDGQQGDLPPMGAQLIGGQGFPRLPLRAGKDGRIISSSATGKLDEGKNLSESELKEAIEKAVELAKNETSDSADEQNMFLDASDSMRLLKLQKKEQELAGKYAENHPELLKARNDLERFALAQSGAKNERAWEMRQQREPVQSASLKMRLLEAQASSELVRGKVGTGHPDYEQALSNVRILESQLEEQDREQAAKLTSTRVEQVRDSLKKVSGSFNRLDELKKTGSTRDRQEELASLRRKLLELEATSTMLEQQVGNGHPNVKTIRTQIGELKKNFVTEKKAIDAAVAAKSWKRVKAIPNTTRLMVGDKEELDLNGMQVNAQVDGFRARVLVDYFFYNDRERQLEGNFKLRLPDDASLYYFAFGESAYEFSPEGKLAAEEFLSDGTQFVSLGAQDVKRARKGQWDNVKESRMVPKEKAAHAFRETVRRRVDPALVEWSGAGVFSAKVFPIAPKKLHRIVVGYDVNLKRSADGLKFELSLPEQTGQCRVEVNVQDIKGVKYSVTPEADPIPTEIEGKLQKRFVFDNDDNQLSKIELAIGGGNDLLLSSTLNATLPLGGSGDAAPKGSTRLGREPGDTASNDEAGEESGRASEESVEEVRPPRASRPGRQARPSQGEGGSDNTLPLGGSDDAAPKGSGWGGSRVTRLPMMKLAMRTEGQSRKVLRKFSPSKSAGPTGSTLPRGGWQRSFLDDASHS